MATLKFNFLCFLFIIICYSAYKQREYKNLTKDTLKPRQTGKSTNSPRRYKWSTFFAPFFNMIGCRSCQCWCVGCQNRWWSTEEDSSLEFKTSKVWTNNETLNVSPHPASRVLVSFICLILAHSSLLSMCCLLLACCWGTVSYPGIIAGSCYTGLGYTHWSIDYEQSLFSSSVEQNARDTHVTEGAWRESFSRLAASLLDARASVLSDSPCKKRDCT